MSLLEKQDARLFCKLCGEMNDLYHELTLKSGITESAFTVFYGITVLGDGCLQKDICDEFYANKQTINASVRKLKQTGYLYLEPGKGRDKHIRLTDLGKQFVEKNILPIIQMEDVAFESLSKAERAQLLCLAERYMVGFRRQIEKL